MRTHHAVWLSLLTLAWLGCSTTTPPMRQAWDEAAEAECAAPHEDQCVTLLCLGDRDRGHEELGELTRYYGLSKEEPSTPSASSTSPIVAASAPGGTKTRAPCTSMMTWLPGPQEEVA